MANYDIARPVVAKSGFGASLKSLVPNLVSTIVAWNEARMTRNTLNALSDRELDDLGLSRGDIDALFR